MTADPMVRTDPSEQADGLRAACGLATRVAAETGNTSTLPGRIDRKCRIRATLFVARVKGRPRGRLTTRGDADDAAPAGQGPPHVRARRTDRHRHLLRGAERGVPGPRHAQLLGRVL